MRKILGSLLLILAIILIGCSSIEPQPFPKYLKNDTSFQNCIGSNMKTCESVNRKSDCQIGNITEINDYKCVCRDICPKNALCELQTSWKCTRPYYGTDKICCGLGENVVCLTRNEINESNCSCKTNKTIVVDGKEQYDTSANHWECD